MPYYFHFGESLELSAIHWLTENRPWQPSAGDTLTILVAAACRQCLIEACWEDAQAIALCQKLIARTHPSVFAQKKLLEQCQLGDLEAFEQALLRLKQQVEIEIMKLPDANDLADRVGLLNDPAN